MATHEVGTAIIGAGQAGVPLARALSGAGHEVALIERGSLGGSCVNWGCTPSKAVIPSARLAAQARRAAEWGVRIPHVEVDFPAVMDRARGMVAEARGELEQELRRQHHLHLFRADARLDGRGDGRVRVRAGDDVILAERVVLDTGTRSLRPPVEGLDRVPLIDAESWIHLQELPRRLVFLGGGTIALEMAQTFRRFGAEVAIAEQGSQLTEHEDPEVAEALRDAARGRRDPSGRPCGAGGGGRRRRAPASAGRRRGRGDPCIPGRRPAAEYRRARPGQRGRPGLSQRRRRGG